MPWACERCREIHTQNPNECRNCGHRIFDPIDAETVEKRSSGVGSPETATVEKDRVMGTTPDPEYESSPAVAVDGSAQVTEEYEDHPPKSGSAPLRSGLLNRLRATVLAPIGLLRRYLVPILAFALVFGAALYLLFGL